MSEERESKFPGRTVTVDLGEKSYPIYVGSGTLEQFGQYYLRHCRPRRTVIVTDETVEPLYGQAVLKGLQGNELQAHLLSVPAGEKSKRMATVELLYDHLFDLSIERSDVIVALGGGVIGDMAGFVAATFKRGLRYVQVPTTLLAMVDSSIGGKTGINHPRGKNMIGAFHQPRMVFADVATLKTLPERELGCGLAETVKHGIIRDDRFFGKLEQQNQAILARDQDLMIELVERNCQIKAAVVAADERESGLRGILNCGHTIGHAIETIWAANGGDIHHGEAVSLGLMAAGRLAVQRGLLTQEELERIGKLLSAFRLPVQITALPGTLSEIPIAELYQAMLHDKKVQGGKIKFVLPQSIGDCVFVDDLTEPEIKQAIESL